MPPWVWVRILRDDPNLDGTTKCVGYVLASYARGKGSRQGTCYPSREQIARGASKSKRTVTECVRRLVSAGYLVVARRYDATNVYTFTEPADEPF